MELSTLLTKQELDLLYENALKGYNNSYSPYSNFKVGASCLLKNGKVFYSCNIENSSYGLTVCAERNTLFKVFSEGYRKDDIKALMVIGKTSDPVSPCGACRQVMSELMGVNGLVVLTNLNKDFKFMTVTDLLPYTFTEEHLHEW